MIFILSQKMYSARMNEDWIEREIDHILIIQADIELVINHNEVSEVKWVSRDELASMLVGDIEFDGEIAPI